MQEGWPPSVDDVATALGSTPYDVARAFDRLAESHVIVLEPGTSNIVMANPLSGVPTGFRVETGGRSLWGNCIWDALGIPPMLGSEGVVATACGDCGEPMELEVRNGVLEPAEGVAHYAVPAAKWWDDIRFT